MKPPESGACHASVAVPVPVRRQFTYRVPEALRSHIEVGTRVRVPFGARKVTATVVEFPVDPPEPGVRVRPLEATLPDEPSLPADLLELTRFVAGYYLCSWGDAIEAALPPRGRSAATTRWVRRLAGADATILPARATAQRKLLERIPESGEPIPVNGLSAAERRAVAPLAGRGLVEVVTRKRPPDVAAQPPTAQGESPPTPTAAQQGVLDRLRPALEAETYDPFVLFGATGSGKTEVYLRAAQSTLERGRSVLYLVPEIGLTPLLLSKISRRFPGQAVVLHSGLARARRQEAWRRVREGRCRLVVGARSAVFAPLREIGLIVVDEEQDGSYKQGETPRYNGRDLAVVRARSSNAVLLLGSATPSMESFHHAAVGRYGLLRLGERIERRPLASVSLVDMREEYRRAGKLRPLSEALTEALRSCLDRGEQALVLRNRRGWSVALLCPACGTRVSCPRCSISLTWHRSAARLRCHHCNFETIRSESCATCGSEELKLTGEGTEQIEDLIEQALPGVRLERMDRDTIRKRGAHEAMLRRFERGEIDVLVGTQMIAKGHDFPRVTLVGVVSADQSLGLPDFRAGERTFQLLTQVAGRAGRGERPGRVVVQVFDAQHPVVRLAARQDYEAFFEREMRYRRAIRYPPVSALVQLIVHDPDELQAREWAERIGEALRQEGGGRLIIAGPGPAPMERLRGRFRQQILARSAGRRRLVEAVDRALASVEGQIPARAIQVDVDAISLL